MKKKILSVLLAACLALTLLPTAAWATGATASITHSSLYFRDAGDGTGTEYSTNNTNWTSYTGSFTITGESTSDSVATNTVVVLSGTHDITLSDCSIGAATAEGASLSTALSPFDIQAGAVVSLTLVGENKLYSAYYIKAGLRVAPEASLTVMAASTGSLDARCQKNNGDYGHGAGIGGNKGGANGTITINGGEISAYSFHGAGIGSGYEANSDFGDIAISGGTVFAKNNYTCGIGYGNNSSSNGTVTITGGSVRSVFGISTLTSKIGGTVQNDSCVGVELYTLRRPEGNANTSVTGLTTTPNLGYPYGTSGMKTDSDGKLYVYLPSGKTNVSVTVGSTTFAGTISDNAATLTQLTTYAVSGTVIAVDPGVDVSGLTVNLYEASDSTFSTSVGSATTGTGGVYTIHTLPGSYVARVAGVAGSYAASVSGTITVGNAAVSDVNITLAALTTQSIAVKPGTHKTTYHVGDSLDVENLNITVTCNDSYNYDMAVTVGMVSGFNSTAVATSQTLTVTFDGKTATYDISVSRAPYSGAPVSASTISGTPTSDSITIITVAGNEYYISTSETAPATWPTSGASYHSASGTGTNTFSDLSAATQYYIHVRVAQTATAMPSASASVAQYTLPTTPAAGVVTVNYAAETFTFTSAYEVSASEGFSSLIVSGTAPIQPGTICYVRVAANGGAPASEAVSFTLPGRPATPTAITAAETKNSITITPVAGQEYKIGTGAWQDSGSFTGLSANTAYTVYTRVKATGTAFASAEYSISVTTKSVGSVTIPTPAAVTYDPAKTLANVTLPDKWDWSNFTTVPTVAINSYSAIYTPTDTDTVDYSGEAGYTNTGGTVTITRTIPLTVNRATPTAADFTYTAPTPLAYNGTEKSATAAVNSGISGMGTVTVKYYPGGSTTAPVNAGTYTVKIDIAQGDNYAAASDITDSAWTFTIAKVAQAPLAITDEPASVTYGDTFTLATTGGSGTGAVTWAVISGDSATVDANTGVVTITGLNQTTITATHEADGNYLAAVTDTYTFTPVQLQLTVAHPSADGGWTKTYDGGTAFETADITVGGITNKVGTDEVIVSVAGAAYDAADVGSGDKTLTITYAIDGADSANYSAPANTVVSTASITAAAPTITLVSKTAVHTGSIIEIAAAAVTGVTAEGDITANYTDAITYTYYTNAACADSDKTTVDRSGADTLGGAPKTAGTYYVKAAVDASGNYTAATSAAVTLTIYNPSSGGSASSGAPVIVDGKTVNIGTEKTSGGATTVTVDQSKLGENISGAASGSSVVVPVSENGAAIASLVVKNIEDMAEKGMTLTVQTGSVAYNLNTAAIDTAALAAAFPGADMSKVSFDVTIQNSAVSVEGETLVLAPVAFTVTAAYNGKTVSVDTFSAYIDRVIEVTAEQAAKITTAVVVNADGSTRHVPTKVIEKDGKYYAIVSSRTNSTYALIHNEVTFADAEGKWFEAAVNEMGSRKIIAGRSATVYDGEAGITRAEFSAILVRALGLPADGTSSFSDVPTSAWYAGAVATAAQYGIVSGKGENRFEPDAAITRQEAMVMLQRAAALTEFAGTSGALDGFADADAFGSWAQDAAGWSVGSDLFQGADGRLNPTAGITRAESATIILRLLQKAELVDVRSEA